MDVISTAQCFDYQHGKTINTQSVSLCNVGSKNENIDRKSEKKKEKKKSMFKRKVGDTLQ